MGICLETELTVVLRLTKYHAATGAAFTKNPEGFVHEKGADSTTLMLW